MRKNGRGDILLTIVLVFSTFGAAQNVRHFKAEHGVGATYVKLEADGRHRVIGREHMGIFMTDEGRWQQTGDVLTFNPTNPKRTPYQTTENTHHGEIFLAITSVDAAAGIVIPADDTKKELDADQDHLPDQCQDLHHKNKEKLPISLRRENNVEAYIKTTCPITRAGQ